MTMQIDTLKSGDSFERLVQLPDTIADGQFAGWQLACQVRTASGQLVAQVDAEWVDPITTRQIRLRQLNTLGWPAQRLLYDVQFTSPAGWVLSSGTQALQVEMDVTRP